MTLQSSKMTLELINNGVQFKGICEDQPDFPITFDYLPPLGNSEGYLGLDVLLMSFAGCVSTAVVGILRKMGKPISAYSFEIVGNKNEKPLYLESIDCWVRLTASEVSDQDMAFVLGEAEKISPVWLAIKNNVRVNLHYELVKSLPLK